MNAVQQFRVGAVDVDDALMRADLELLAAVLIFMGRAEDRDDLLFGGQRDRPADLAPLFCIVSTMRCAARSTSS